DLLGESADVATCADLLLGLADALGAGGSFEDSVQRYREAARLADRSNRRHLQLAVMNNLAFTLYEAGRAAEAVAIVEQLQEQAELYAAQGLYKDAYETLRDFHLADVELRAVERDSRARTLNAIFEATEARRSSDYFRELSVRDPLTGLHNRRHLDT